MGLKTVAYSDDFLRLFMPFLSENGFILTTNMETNFSYIHEFRMPGIRLHFNYDIRDNFFYFVVIYGDGTVFPNDSDNVNIIPLMKIFKESNLTVNVKDLQPDENQYINALERNVEFLKKTFSQILK
jgi:hypothetical protein